MFTGQWQSRATRLDDYKPYLDQRWQEGCTNAWKLWEEIREQGYPRGYASVSDYVSRTLRGKPQQVGPRPPSARAVTRWTLTHLDGDQLPEWIEAASATTELPSLRNFAQHLLRDLEAVPAGLTLPWNSGVVEGHVNRIKMLKRQMFGRAGFALLRKRVLLAT
nr:transposase [Streptomyces sp. AC1-42T]